MPARRPFGRVMVVGFGLAAAAVLFVGVNGHLNVCRLIEADRNVSRTYQVRRDLAELLARLTDAETGQRGYVITGDERFLAPYVTALEHIQRLTAQLRVLMADTPDQLRGLDRIDVQIAAKFAELKQTVEMRRKDGFDPAAKVIAGGDGKKIMDDIRGLIADMDRQEQARLDTRRAEAELMARRAKIAALVGGGGGALAVALVGWYITSLLGRRIESDVRPVHRSPGEVPVEGNRQPTPLREECHAPVTKDK